MTTRQLTLTQFQRKLLTVAPSLEKAMVRGFRIGAQRLKAIAVQNIITRRAVATAQLARSVTVDNHQDGATVLVNAPHADFVESGTRPHRPPIQPLADWAKVKGLARTDAEARRIGFLVARAIAVRGTPPVHYFRDAWTQLQGELPAIMQRELAKVK